MSLRKIGKLVSLLLLYYLLAWYSTRILENIEYENYLIRAWQSSFYKLDVRCIHWITMRIAIWVAVFLELMRLENPLTIYLFIRERNFISLFIKTYCKCLLEVIFYFGLAMLAMAAYFFLLTGSWEVFGGLWQEKTAVIVLRESLDGLNFCLAAYFLYCFTKHAEISFLVILTLRLLLGFAVKGEHIGVWTELFVNILLAAGTLYYASRNFVKRLNGDN